MVEFYREDVVKGLGSASSNSISKKFNPKTMINSHDIEKNGLEWAMMNTFHEILKPNQAIVVNTDMKGNDGIHWLVLYLKDNVVYLIDSLGGNNKRPYDKQMKATINDMGYTLKIYPYASQYEDNSLCGWHSIYVAKRLNQNQPKNVFKYIHNIWGDDANDADVQKLIDGFGLTKGHQLDKIFNE